MAVERRMLHDRPEPAGEWRFDASVESEPRAAQGFDGARRSQANPGVGGLVTGEKTRLLLYEPAFRRLESRLSEFEGKFDPIIFDRGGRLRPNEPPAGIEIVWAS